MNVKQFFEKNYIHFVAIGIFLIVGFAYFSKQFGDYALKQHDIEAYKGMSAETSYHEEVDGAKPDWNNSLFGGMPNALLSPKTNGNVMKAILKGWNKLFPNPMGIFLLHLVCFYVMALFLRIKPVIGIIGAFAFAFMSYEIIILQAGHNTKAAAVAILPAIFGAFVYTFRTNWKIGAIFSALFFGLEIAAGHPQVTYYMAFLLLAVGIYFLVDAIIKRTYKKFALSTLGVVIGYSLAILINYGHLSAVNSYSKYSMRGEGDIEMPPQGDVKKKSDGLELDYITNWSLDRGETFSFVSPYVRGSHSAPFNGSRFEYLVDEVEFDNNGGDIAPKLGMYWGNQPGTSGPFYMGVIVVFLAFLALLFVRKPIVYVLFGLSILLVLLSWGKNLMGLTEFFVEHVPFYNKFRTVTIILVIVELIIPVLAVFLLQYLYDNREKLKEQKKLFFIGSGAFLLILIFIKFAGGTFTGVSDENILQQQENSVRQQISATDAAQLAEMGIDKNNPEQVDQLVERQLEPIQNGIDGAKTLRREMYSKSTTRSILFTVLAIGILSLLFLTKIPTIASVAALGVFILIDMVPVNLNYLGSDEAENGDYLHWIDKSTKLYPIASTAADQQILEMELSENPGLEKHVREGERLGTEKAEEYEFEGAEKRRVVDFYKFRSLASATNYRVIDLSGGWFSAWNSSENAYLHKSLGGYHGAKLFRIQNIFDFHLANSNNLILNMMNVRYIIRGNEVNKNPDALGNAWAIQEVKTVDNPDQEIRSLGKSFRLTNEGSGTMLVNNQVQNDVVVYGYESLQYVQSMGDTVRIPMSNGITPGMEAIAVRDVKGSVNLVPQVTLDRDTLNSFVKLAKIEGLSDFDPSKEVILLEKEAKKISKKKYSGEAQIEMTSFHPDKIEYTVEAKGKQFVVFSEMYHPDGWTATIDGKEKEIVKANYLLRGLEVPGGKHKVVLEFRDSHAARGKTMSYIGFALLLLMSVAVVFFEIKDRRKQQSVE